MNGATTLPRRAPAWRRLIPPFLRGGRLAALVEGVTLALFLGMAGLTYYLLSGSGQSYTLLTPPIVALLLVANLVPAIALLVLLGRRVAKRRAAASAIGSDGQLHVRLVAIFSIVASVPFLTPMPRSLRRNMMRSPVANCRSPRSAFTVTSSPRSPPTSRMARPPPM